MKKQFIISVHTENQIGLLNRIAIIFSRRKINIDNLNTFPSGLDNIHRFIICIRETEGNVQKIVKQIQKQVDVLDASYNI